MHSNNLCVRRGREHFFVFSPNQRTNGVYSTLAVTLFRLFWKFKFVPVPVARLQTGADKRVEPLTRSVMVAVNWSNKSRQAGTIKATYLCSGAPSATIVRSHCILFQTVQLICSRGRTRIESDHASNSLPPT